MFSTRFLTRNPLHSARRPLRMLLRRPLLELLEDRTLPSGTALSATAAAYEQLPLSFEANQGQTDSQVAFLARGQGYGLYLTSTAAVLNLNTPTSTGANVVGMQLVGANAAATSVGQDPLPGVVNYFIGNDPSQWLTNISTFGRAQFHGVYGGIDVVYYGNQGQLEYDFNVAPGADPGQVRLDFTGTTGMDLDSAGNLVLHTTGGDVVEDAPVLYQMTPTGRQSVAGGYVMLGNGQVGFQVGHYDTTVPLVIDPTLSYSTYLGGSLGDKALAVAADSSGDAYITGETGSPNFPVTPGAFDTTNHGQNTVTDVFVTKLNPAGQLVYSTFLGGSSDDHGTGIAVDSSGDAYVTGWTQQSTNYPVTAGAFQATYNHGQDGFVTKLNAAGSALVYSTYLGGSSDDEPHAIAVDSQGFAYIAGDTFSTDFPTKNPIQGGVNNSNDDGFLTKLNQAGTALVYSTYLRGSGNDAATGVAVDSAGEAIVVGYTDSIDFPTTANAFQKARGGDPAQTVTNTFVTKINAGGTAYGYSTYLGGSVGALFDVSNGGPAVATDASGAAYVTGDTEDPDFPVTADAAQQTKNFTDMFGLASAFVTKLDTNGGMVYSTYLGGGGLNTEDGGRGIAVDAQGDAYVTGFTADTSTPFPLDFPIQTTPGQPASFTKPGDFDAFVTRVSADGSKFDYSSYLGGKTYDYGRGIALDGNGNAYVVGITRSFANASGGTLDNFPLLNALDSTPPSVATGDTTGFVSRVNLLEPGAGTFYLPAQVTETTEAAGFVTIQVARRDGDTTAANISYSTSDGTAHAGTNYTTTSGTLAFAAGQHLATFNVPIIDDHANDNTPFLTFHVTLSNPTAGAVLDNTAATADIHSYDVETTRTDNDLFDNALPLAGSSVTATGSNVGATSNTGGDDSFDYPVTDSKSVSNPKNDGGSSVWWVWSPSATGMTTIDTFGSDFDTLLSVFSANNHLVENDDAPGRTDGTSAVTFLAHQGTVYRIDVQGYDFGGGAQEGNITLHINGAASAGTLQFSQPSYVVSETAGSLTIPVTRSGGSAGAVSIQVATSDGTAHAGTDYTAVTQTLSWAAGDASTKNVVIPITNSGSTGQSPTFNVTLSNAGGGAAIGSPNPVVVVITEPASSAGALQFSAPTYSASDTGGSISITVTRTGGSTGAVGVHYATSNGTASSGVDYTATSGTLSWASGDASSKTFTIPILDDLNPNGSETVNLTLSSPTGGATLGSPSSAVLTLTDVAGTLQFSAASYSATEGGTNATITVTRASGSNGSVAVAYATGGGTAVTGKDYTAVSGTLTFAAGVTSQSFTVPVLNNGVSGGSETVGLTLSSPTRGATFGQPQQRHAHPSERRRAAGAVGLQRRQLQCDRRRSQRDHHGHARQWQQRQRHRRLCDQRGHRRDRTGLHGRQRHAHLRRRCHESVLHGPRVEQRSKQRQRDSQPDLEQPHRRCRVGQPQYRRAYSPERRRATRSAGLQRRQLQCDRRRDSPTITVTRTNGSSGSVTVAYATGGGTAVAGQDYTAVSGTLTFAAGVTSQTFIVPVLNNGRTSGSETVNLTLSSPGGGATLTSPSAAVLTLQNAAQPGQLAFSAASYSATEGGANATITVARTNGSSGSVTVAYAAGGGTAVAGQDYTAVSGTLTFAAGVASQSFTVPILSNGQANGSETVNLTLSSPGGGATLGSPSTAVLTIQNSGGTSLASQLHFAVPAASVPRTGRTAVLTVVRTGGISGTDTVQYATTDGTAHSGTNYTTTNGTLTFGPGTIAETISVPILDNGQNNGNEIFTLSLGSPTGGAVLNTPSAVTVTINDPLPVNPSPASIGTVASALTHSGESYGDFVTRAYALYLKRSPDASGLAYWVNRMQNQGLTDESLEAGFIGSTEYIQDHGGAGQGWVIGMYEDLLGRGPDAAGLSYWTNYLASGGDPSSVALGFAASAEREGQRIGADYEIFLGRALDAAGQAYWVNQFLSGARNEAVVAGFLASAEYYQNNNKGQSNLTAWVDSVFEDVYNRAPTSAELASWLSQL